MNSQSLLNSHSLLINSHYLLNSQYSINGDKKVGMVTNGDRCRYTLGAAAFVYLLVERDGTLSAAL